MRNCWGSIMGRLGVGRVARASTLGLGERWAGRAWSKGARGLREKGEPSPGAIRPRTVLGTKGVSQRGSARDGKMGKEWVKVT